MKTDFFRLLVHDALADCNRHNLVVECARFLRRCRPLLTLQSKFVLLLTADAVPFCDDFGRLQHRHVNVGCCFKRLGIRCPVPVVVFVLYETDRFEATTDNDRHVVFEDLFCGDGDCHHARRALPVDGHAGDGYRQTGRN